MNSEQIIKAIQTAVDLRNQIQTAIASGAHILPAVPAAPAANGKPAVPAKPEVGTGQLPTASGFAHQLANILLGHLQNVEDDLKIISQAKAIIATPAPAPAPATAAAADSK